MTGFRARTGSRAGWAQRLASLLGRRTRRWPRRAARARRARRLMAHPLGLRPLVRRLPGAAMGGRPPMAHPATIGEGTAPRPRRPDRRGPLRLGLLCGAGAILLLALQALGHPLEGEARPATEAGPLPPSAFRPVRLPERASTGSDPGKLDSAGQGGAGRLGDPGRGGEGEPDGFASSSAADGPAGGEAGLASAVVPDRVLAGLRPPVVVRFRPRDGARDVDPGTKLSVRFSAPMDRPSTERAFRVLVDGRSIGGRTWWAEDDTVLVLELREPLPRGAVVRLVVGADARSRIGLPLVALGTATIRVAPAPTASGSSGAGGAGSGSGTAAGWRWPHLGSITQRFGESLTRYGWHNGIDIDGETGDPVVAARAGRVTVAGRYDACGGLEVHIDHGDGFETWYRHLSAVEVGVGRWVGAGLRIGRVGDTGCSFGSHLHFAVRRNGAWVDPLRYLPPR